MLCDTKHGRRRRRCRLVCLCVRSGQAQRQPASEQTAPAEALRKLPSRAEPNQSKPNRTLEKFSSLKQQQHNTHTQTGTQTKRICKNNNSQEDYTYSHIYIYIYIRYNYVYPINAHHLGKDQ